MHPLAGRAPENPQVRPVARHSMRSLYANHCMQWQLEWGAGNPIKASAERPIPSLHVVSIRRLVRHATRHILVFPGDGCVCFAPCLKA